MFALKAHEDRIRRVYAAMGPAFPDELRSLTLELMLDYKTDASIETARAVAQRESGREPVIMTSGREPVIMTKDQAAEFIRNSPEVLQVLQGRVLQWELAVGIATLCAVVIIKYRVDAERVLGSEGTVAALLCAKDDPPSAAA